MKTTQFNDNHKVNNCVKNAYRAILNGHAVPTIWASYGNPSIYKVRAWEWCKASCRDDSGHGLCVTGWNMAKFTCAYFCSHHETGEQCLIVRTADNIYWCYLSELNL